MPQQALCMQAFRNILVSFSTKPWLGLPWITLGNIGDGKISIRKLGLVELCFHSSKSYTVSTSGATSYSPTAALLHRQTDKWTLWYHGGRPYNDFNSQVDSFKDQQLQKWSKSWSSIKQKRPGLCLETWRLPDGVLVLILWIVQTMRIGAHQHKQDEVF